MPLSGTRVIDLSRLLPGPFCSQILGDFGADVIKVEDTGFGDPSRIMPPFFEGEGGAAESAAFLFANRNKRSVALDLKHEAGREALRRLVRGADVLLEGFRPGVLDRLGAGWEVLRRENPRLVYCALTGYGQDGPYRDRAGHDINYLGYAGALAMTGPADGAPVPPGIPVADLTGALYAALGILLALRARERTGEGQFVDAAMLDGAVSLLWMHAGRALLGERPRRRDALLSGARPFYGTYETSDGRYLAVGSLEPKFWETFCRAIGREDLIPLQLAEGADADRLRGEIAAAIRARPLAEWTALFDGLDACVSPVLEVEEALENEQVIARGLRRAMPHPALGLIPQIGPGMRLRATPAELRRAPPRLGEHTDEVLAEVGYSKDEIAAMRAAGAIR